MQSLTTSTPASPLIHIRSSGVGIVKTTPPTINKKYN